MAQLAGIAGNFQGRKLSCIGEKYDFCEENFHGLLPSAAPTYCGETLVNSHITVKFAKVFSFKSFPLYSTSLVKP